ncbi:MAG: deoxyguanosinetriphosphate triphosphohydrolase [Zymomonas mobilis subsp. pomaceae]|uniref:Deoxyguanosinetriphosphate triphosphohydrolase-like protein n=1 Tax=Zymomonas mobilis subsp. pomaceae (strain ATCC 29192 / DSM 22645 / JCM 10191 / CCUG 17912 / NBRC 13757 / NCIMB 11200 / NRRL B-4491 / Barker I) TaxID=579138 RepID=F8EVB9_ZYMMT|nr:deoxyguanosinetriphosphate triphosphohydrolase [Zymomonas mobilis]AEI37326.1 deoxyguanosinetriphosphate triphosphohydrolase [Zymomonas mobilis subsp. pomaceae ATCC 29192]MDX5948694.1 deoxyguanosinetriphosphate triphosphohydrolase [Zymomonas mobilis subsp. pomaceae]GEB88499.1 deoxyguanosinetriphosphate triphosphohydrolase-like protein [Zymomonas mobilis subsp. pomaceae]
MSAFIELAPYAAHPDLTRGRLHNEGQGETRGPRNAFQRDRDRIIHSMAFRRLRHKTQVFIAPESDHFRVRLTHSLEVAQIGRTIARVLGLNEDLTEALCLAHDIGHPPFGHVGEFALKRALEKVGGFDHNAHSLRILTHLESPYPRWRGLNLTWDMQEGLAKHNGPVKHPGWALAEINQAFPLDLESWPSLEAQVAAHSDDIAYDNHDLDDGLRAGLIDFEEVIEQPLIAPAWQAVRNRYPDLPEKRLRPELIREQIGRMVNDTIVETRYRLAALKPETIDDVRHMGQAIVSFSEKMAVDERDFKRFMYAKLYHHPILLDMADKAGRIVTDLIEAYNVDPSLLPSDWRETLPENPIERQRHIADFIAGMTDSYALKRYQQDIGAIDIALH